MKPILIHIGYQKTGSTWLQKELFIADNEVFEPLSHYPNGPSTLSWSFIKGEDKYALLPFQMNEKRIKEVFTEIIKYKKDKLHKTFVMSCEDLSGKTDGGGFYSKDVAHRLHNVFPNSKILIVIREQESFLLSNYFQYLSMGGLFSLKKYLNLSFDTIPHFNPHFINYNHLVREYYNLFGKQNVLVLPYEMFKSSPKTFVNKLAQFIDKPILVEEKRFKTFHNQRKGHAVMYYFRWLNHFRKYYSMNNYSEWSNKYTRLIANKAIQVLIKITPDFINNQIKNYLKKYIKDWTSNRYEEANQELSELIGIDLSEYGYY